jgi:hypothetical protein
MKLLLILICWCLLLFIYWPLAVAAVVLFPLLWVAWLPVRVLLVVVEAVFAFLKAVLLLPARLLGYK